MHTSTNWARCSPPTVAATRSRTSCGWRKCPRPTSRPPAAPTFWPALEALAPTLAYDAACLGDGRPPASFASIEQPALVVTGERDGAEWVRALAPAADALVALLPHGERATLGAGEHVADPEAFAALLARWFTSR